MDEFTTFISGVPYPESLLPEPEIVDLSDEEDDDKGKHYNINLSKNSSKNSSKKSLLPETEVVDLSDEEHDDKG